MSEKSKTIEEKMDELRKTVAWFEGEEFSLTEAGDKLKAALKIAKAIEYDLSNMENQITVLKKSFEEV